MPSRAVAFVSAIVAITALNVALPRAALATTRGVTFTDPQDEATNPAGPTRADLASGTVAYEDSYGTIGVSVSFWRPVSESPPGDGTQGYSVAVELYSSPGSDCGASSLPADVTLFLDLNRGSFGNAIFASARGQYIVAPAGSLTTSEDGLTLSGTISNPLLERQDLRCLKATVRYQGYPPSSSNTFSYDSAGPVFFDGCTPPPLPPAPPPPAPRPAQTVDRTPPFVRAFKSTGRQGRNVRLYYRVRDNRGETREGIGVYRGTRRVKFLHTGFGKADWWMYSVAWRAPRSSARFRFCVQSWDRAGNRSTQSCAPISLRR